MQTFLTIMQRTIQPGERFIVAVSGGADSMALLHLVQSYQTQFGYEFEVAHIHHHLREASDDEWTFVEDYCARQNILFHGCHLDVLSAQQGSGKSIEAVAHELRLVALQKIVRERGAKRLLLAHHANDRAETILMNILRGSAGKGLAAMPMIQGNIFRPLLSMTRSDIEDYCEMHHLAYVVDESNADTRITRNRIRHELLPVLMSYNHQIVTALNRLAENTACDQDFIEQHVQEVYEQCVVFHGDRWCLLKQAPLANSHRAIQAAMIRGISEKFLGTRSSVHHDILQHCLMLIEKGQGQYDLGKGLVFEWTKNWCYIGFKPKGSWERQQQKWTHSFLEGVFEPQTEALQVRSYKSRDVIYEKGIGRKSVKKIFQEEGLPLCLRTVWPIVYNKNSKEIICIPFLAPTRELVYDIKGTNLGTYSLMTIIQKKCAFRKAF